MQETKADPESRYLFVKGQLGSGPLTITNIYCPNSGQVTFFLCLCSKLADFTSGVLTLGGDFNVSLNPLMDTLTSSSTLPYRALRQINLQLQNLQLHDSEGFKLERKGLHIVFYPT